MKEILDEPLEENEKEKEVVSDLEASAKLFIIAMIVLGIGGILFMIIYFFGLGNNLITGIIFIVLVFGFFGYLALGIFYGIKGFILKIW